MTPSRLLTRLRPDETLYSAAARLCGYLGSPHARLMNEALFEASLPVIDSDLPVGLHAVVGSGVFGRGDVADALHEWTLFPYYAHYVAPLRADVGAEAMFSLGRWPHGVLRSWSAAVPPIDRLRFCPRCCQEMLTDHPDLWWRRAHQLPSVLVCPDHGEPLRESPVSRGARSSAYLPATAEMCPGDAAAVVVDINPREQSDLLALARASEILLDRECDQHPDDRRMEYLRRLDRLGLLNRAGMADLGKVARALDGWWGTTLRFWPGLQQDGRCRQRWLGALLWGEHGSPPLHHLLLERMLDGRGVP